MSRLHAGPLCIAFTGTGRAVADLRDGVLTWRDDLRAALAGQWPESLDWDEDPDGEQLVLSLGDAGRDGLRLWALYAEKPELEFPDAVPSPLELDKNWREASDAKFAGSRYGHVLAPSLWLPADFAFTVAFPLPDGRDAEIGSLSVLLDQLRWLNGRTFEGDGEALAAWRELEAGPRAPLLDAARRGLAVLLHGAEWATQHAVPLLAR